MSSKLSRRSLLITVLAAPLWLLLKGCSQFADSTKCTTERVLTIPELRAHFPGKYIVFGDTSYSEVNPAFAPKWHSYTEAIMSALGMAANWSTRFDCNRFATVKMAVIYVRYLVDNWHSWSVGTSPCAGEYWFYSNATPGGPSANIGRPSHAIIVTVEGGRKMFRDIYSERELALTPAEQDSVYFIKF